MDADKRREERLRISEEKKLAQSKLRGRLESEDNNPCLNEHKLSNKCMMDNKFDKDSCEMYFENYKVCKSFWWSVQRDRRLRGIEPELPPVDERARIKEDFMKKFYNN